MITRRSGGGGQRDMIELRESRQPATFGGTESALVRPYCSGGQQGELMESIPTQLSGARRHDSQQAVIVFEGKHNAHVARASRAHRQAQSDHESVTIPQTAFRCHAAGATRNRVGVRPTLQTDPLWRHTWPSSSLEEILEERIQKGIDSAAVLRAGGPV